MQAGNPGLRFRSGLPRERRDAISALSRCVVANLRGGDPVRLAEHANNQKKQCRHSLGGRIPTSVRLDFIADERGCGLSCG